MLPFSARGATIYAFSSRGNTDHRLLKFDSATPWEIEESLPINGEIVDTDVSLEFDPETQELYGFGFTQCQVLCPAIATFPMKFDLLTGDLSYLE